jgi:hypothetical protein
MIRTWCVILSLILLFPSPGRATPFSGFDPISCFNLLRTKEVVDTRERSEVRFKESIESIRASGAVELLRPLDEGRIEVIYKPKRVLWQSMVNGRQNWRGMRSLLLRDLDYSNEKEKQMIIWQTAMALFELETRSNIWSRRSMLTPDDQRRFDLSMKGSDENLSYFLVEQPAEWRDLQIKKIETLEVELYTLFTKLNQLNPEDLLPKKDPGRLWIARSIYGGDSSRAIAPNQADFEVWKESAKLPSQSLRHGRSLIFNYYMNFMKRAMVLALIAQAAVLAPELQSLPSHLDAIHSSTQMNRELNQTVPRSEEENRRYIESIKAQVSAEAERLKREIKRQKEKAEPNLGLIKSLEQELIDLRDLYPWLSNGRQ